MGKNFVENYESMDDGELISLINQGKYEYLQEIIARYVPMILYHMRKCGYQSDREDVMQEALIALYSAVKTYDAGKASFSTYASLCIKRAMIALMKSDRRKKTVPDELLSSLEEEGLVDANSPEKIFFDREAYQTLTETIRLELSGMEYRVLQLYLSGMKYSKIAADLGISEKAVDNSLVRIRRKLKEK